MRRRRLQRAVPAPRGGRAQAAAVRPAHPRLDLRRPSRLRPFLDGGVMTSDILSAIDAATESLCACGCGVPLEPAGPSAWFATQDCQRRWGDGRTTSPHSIYARPEPHWSESELDAMGAPPARRSEHAVATVGLVREMRSVLQRTRPTPPVRPPRVDGPRTGCRLALFVGGPWDGDIRAVPAAEDYWMVADEPLDYFVAEEPWALSIPETTSYCARSVWVCLPPMYELGLFERWESRLRVFAAGNPSDAELMD